MDEIKNKVAESGLIAIDLADFKPNQRGIKEIDLANYLWEGLVLREKDFRASIREINWNDYLNLNVYVHCSADAIVLTWAYMLVASKLEGIAATYLIGSKADMEKLIIQQNIASIDLTLPLYESKRYIIKGCSDITAPAFAMTELMKKVQPTAKSIMYGEPCSTVPIYKKTNF